jgi:predicted RNA-binding protein YlxR (DUF448 family)
VTPSVVTDSNDEADAGPRDRASGTERLCVATRAVKPSAEMIRFVLDPEGVVTPDLRCKLPGRGVWTTATMDAVAIAVARNAFARGFKRPARTSAALAAEVEGLLERAALAAMSIAHKAGLVVAGFAKVEATLEQGRAVARLQATEASPDGVRKLAAAARRADPGHVGDGEADRLPVLLFAGAQLDLALGRSNVVHAALLAGSAAETLLARHRRLVAYRGCEPAKPAGGSG